MTFLHYLIGNAIASVLVAALLIYFSPKSREERMKRRLREEEELFNALVEYAKREKESKPNPDFAPPPEKKPHGYHLTMTTYDAKDYGKTRTFNGEEYERTMVAQSADGAAISMIYRKKRPKPRAPQTDLCDSCHYRNQLCHKTGICKCSNYFKEEPPKPPAPPTTGSIAKKPPPHAEKLKINPEKAILADNPQDTVDKLLKAIRALGLTGECAIDEIVEKIVAIGEINAASPKEIAGTLDRTDKKPVTPERLKEAGFKTEPVTVAKPMDRECKNCRHFQIAGKKWGNCYIHHNAPASWMTCGLFVPVDGPIISCGTCRHFVPDGEENVCNTGVCGEMDMTTVRNYGGCWKYAKKAGARPAPLGTVTVQ